MPKLNIQVMENDYERLEQTAKRMGKTVQGLIHEWVKNLPEQDVKKAVSAVEKTWGSVRLNKEMLKNIAEDKEIEYEV